MISKSTGRWGSTIPSKVEVPYEPGIFQKIAELAAVAIPLPPSPPPQEPPLSDSEEYSTAPDSDSEDSPAASQGSSGWESEASSEEDMTVERLTLDLDTGAATFATS